MCFFHLSKSMNQLYYIKKELLEWRESKIPQIENKFEALVRPFAVAKCDLDDVFLFTNISLKLKIGKLLGIVDPMIFETFGKKFFEGPFPFGHECVAEVVEVGEAVKNSKIGDVVSVPFQISCGSCLHCSSGITSSCLSVPTLSTYGFGKHLTIGGAMTDILKVPYADAMLLKIPEHINPIHLASLSDNVPDAYRAIGPYLENNSDQSVLIVNGLAKSVGLYALVIAIAMGASRVDYVDSNPERLEIAKRIGVSELFESTSQITRKYDIVVEASSTKSGLDAAIKSVTEYGVCTSVGIYMKKTTAPFVQMYSKGILFKTGLTNARTEAEKVLDLIAQNKLDLKSVTTKLDSWNNAIDAFLSKSSKVIVTRERVFLNN